MNESAHRVIRQFAEELAHLRQAVGAPSFRTLESLSNGRRLRRSTAADAVAGDRLPSLPVVLMFVTACHEFACRNHLEVNDEDFNRIERRNKWIAVRELSQRLPERDDNTAASGSVHLLIERGAIEGLRSHVQGSGVRVPATSMPLNRWLRRCMGVATRRA